MPDGRPLLVSFADTRLLDIWIRPLGILPATTPTAIDNTTYSDKLPFTGERKENAPSDGRMNLEPSLVNR